MTTRNHWGGVVPSAEARRKMALAKMGNENAAKPYPAFRNAGTGEVIPPGVNLARMCRERGLCRTGMMMVMHGRCQKHKKWEVCDESATVAANVG